MVCPQCIELQQKYIEEIKKCNELLRENNGWLELEAKILTWIKEILEKKADSPYTLGYVMAVRHVALMMPGIMEKTEQLT